MKLENVLNEHFGFDSFKKGQKEVIKNVLDNKSAAAIFPTGAGKSMCYQLPALLLPHMTLVVSPLLSLMKDQIDFLNKNNVSAARLDSTLSRNEYNRILDDAKSGNLKILMISVERFKNERFRFHLLKMNISLLVVDEAHCISEWGHNFRPEYLKLPDYRHEFKIPQVLLLTATATQQVIDDMCSKFNILRENILVTGFYRKNLYLQVSPIIESEKINLLIKRVSNTPNASTIVYVTLQKTAEEVAAVLKENNIRADHYHAGIKSEDREKIQNQFMDGTLSCIVATIAFGMGIDKRNIRRIVHYDLPKSIENYSQEIGRSGRDGEVSVCEVFANKDNVNILENFIYGDTPEQESLENLLTMIQQNNGFDWEIKLLSLSKELNIRILPLKTLLVYLDIEGIIRPKLTYFEDYSFKYIISPSEIVSNFNGERKNFINSIINCSYTKKTWTSVDIQKILFSYKTDRKRIITALEYLGEQNWIELQSKQSVELYDIRNQSFDIKQMTDKLFALFQTKEKHEISRIHEMLNFFESDSCLSKKLAGYFGEHLEFDKCFHCSFCKKGKRAHLQNTSELKPLTDFDFEELTNEFRSVIGKNITNKNLCKFLCGIYTPIFSKLKIKHLNYFACFERYPFVEVTNWINKNID